MAFEFELPDVGEGIHEGEIVNWLVDEGDSVDEDEDIVEVMTDKATVQISSPVAGTVETLVYEEGAVVEVGEVFVVIEPAEGAKPAQQADDEEADQPQDEPTAEPDVPEEPQPAASRTDGHNPQRTPQGILAPPSVRTEARKQGVDLTQVDGSGPAGRITMEDLETHEPTRQEPETEPTTPTGTGGVSGVLPFDIDPPEVDREQAREIEPLAASHRSPRASGARAMRLQPHFTHAVEIQADDLVDNVERAASRAEADLDLTTGFVVKAVGQALEDHERCNAWVDEESRDLVVADRINVAVATPTEDGLELRTVADANEEGVLEIARTLAEGGDDVEPTFTVTAMGEIGGLVSTPVLVHPQVAGLTMGGIRDVGSIVDGQIQPGKEMSLALAFDHRYVDGYHGAMLAEDVKDLLTRPGSMLLD